MDRKKILILYHGDCNDGLAGAWVAWKKFGARADYVPLYRGDPVPNVRDKEVYMIDFVYDVETTKKMMAEAVRLTAIDHHISGKEATFLTYEPSYALEHSGGVLAWQYFHPKKKIPLLLRYIEDGDIGQWKIPEAEEVKACLNFDCNFSTFSKYVAQVEDNVKRKALITKGKILVASWKKVIRNVAELAEPIMFEGYRAYAVNAPHLFGTDVGIMITELYKTPFAIIWHVLGGKIRVSLRSGYMKKVDLSKLAAKYGGGGHKGAAGFLLDIDKPLPWKNVQAKK